MICYALNLVEGCIHKSFMKIQIGSIVFEVDCSALRQLIRRANEIGVYQVSENLNPKNRTIFEMLYEEFKDDL